MQINYNLMEKLHLKFNLRHFWADSVLPLNQTVVHAFSGNEVSGAFYGLAILQPDSLVLLAEQCSYCGQSFPSESTCLVGLYLQLLGLRSQAGIWSRGLRSLKPSTRACKSAGRTVLMSALLHPASFSPATCWMSSFLSSENAIRVCARRRQVDSNANHVFSYLVLKMLDMF